MLFPFVRVCISVLFASLEQLVFHSTGQMAALGRLRFSADLSCIDLYSFHTVCIRTVSLSSICFLFNINKLFLTCFRLQ